MQDKGSGKARHLPPVGLRTDIRRSFARLERYRLIDSHPNCAPLPSISRMSVRSPTGGSVELCPNPCLRLRPGFASVLSYIEYNSAAGLNVLCGWHFVSGRGMVNSVEDVAEV